MRWLLPIYMLTDTCDRHTHIYTDTAEEDLQSPNVGCGSVAHITHKNPRKEIGPPALVRAQGGSRAWRRRQQQDANPSPVPSGPTPSLRHCRVRERLRGWVRLGNTPLSVRGDSNHTRQMTK